MHILHQFKLMTSNGFGILLILVERIKRDIAQTWEKLGTPEEGINHLDETRIRIMLCVFFTNLN